MPVTVLYFAAAREAAGTPREAVAAPATVGDLRATLSTAHPRLARILPRCRIAVDQTFADDATPVRDGAEIAIVPPVVDRPLALDEVVDAVSADGLGGIVTFTGTVRDLSHGRHVLRLEYEAYVPMAERSLARIGEEVGREHGAAVAIVHRVGVLAPGEAAVVIACAAAHRTPAFRACEACIERLKRDVPIWKREIFDDGSEWVGMGP
jgi:molybdopterin converting factor subunit 1